MRGEKERKVQTRPRLTIKSSEAKRKGEVFKRRVLVLIEKGSVYPAHVKELVEKCPPDLFPVLWDATGGLQLSEAEAKTLAQVVHDESALFKALTRLRSEAKGCRKYQSEIDHYFAVSLKALEAYLCVLFGRYVERRLVNTLHVAQEHLEKCRDVGFGIFEVFKTYAQSGLLEKSFVAHMAQRMRIMARELERLSGPFPR